MESAEQARAFLHEVKAVFGVRNCCFIVAMAEEALESFDAAGKPLYDVMDRAFDQIVHMAYVDLATCGSLLASRAGPRFAEPFVGLCYCLAGGVPRNVIRVARDVVGTALRLRRDRLSEITGEIVSSEIRATVNWARARLAGIDARDASAMVRALDAWAHSRPPDEPLRDRLLDLAALPAGPGDAIEIRSVRNRILTTAYFLLTIVDVFGDDLDEARYARGKREDPPGGSLESLARAHRRLGANDRLAREMIVRFREVWCLPELPGGEPA